MAGSAPVAPDLTRVHYRQLDGLRGIAIIMVMLYHFSLLHPQSLTSDAGIVLQALHFGWMGVDLFFVLSGFLITGILLATRSHTHYFRNFLARRFLRIWPLYYLTLATFFIVLPVVGFVPTEMATMISKQTWFWLYGANWLFAIEGGFNRTSGGYFWSLAVEEQFYIVWPFIVYLLSSRDLLKVAATLLAFSFVSRIVLVATGTSTSSLYAMTFTHLDGLAVGAILAICSQSKDLASLSQRLAPWVLLSTSIVLAIIVASDGNALFWSPFMAAFGYTVIAGLFGALLVCSLRPADRSMWSGTLRSRFLVAAGRYSYALYLIHVPVAALVSRAVAKSLNLLGAPLPDGLTVTIVALVSFATCWLLSMLSWRIVESPILALKAYFPYTTEDRLEASAIPAGERQALFAPATDRTDARTGVDSK